MAVKKFDEWMNEAAASSEETIKDQLVDFVAKKGQATWTEIHDEMLRIVGRDPNDKSNRGWGSSYFSKSFQNGKGQGPGLLVPSRKDGRYLVKKGNVYVVAESVTESDIIVEDLVQEHYNVLNEGNVDLSHPYAIVFVGGSIGQRPEFPIFAKGGMGSIVDTGDDKEALKADAARRRKSLSAGEKKYYGMNYLVMDLTPNKIKEIQYLKDIQNKSNNDVTEE